MTHSGMTRCAINDLSLVGLDREDTLATLRQRMSDLSKGKLSYSSYGGSSSSRGDFSSGDFSGQESADPEVFLQDQSQKQPGEGTFCQGMVSAPVVGGTVGGRLDNVLPVSGGLGRLLPGQGLRKGNTTVLTGARAVLLGLIAETTSAGHDVAVVGGEDLGWNAAVELGADLSRLAVIPHPGSDPLTVASILLDGVDVVILSSSQLRVQPRRAHAIAARLRNCDGVLVVEGAEWPDAALRLTSTIGAFVGLDRGHGRIRGMKVSVNVQAKGQRNQQGWWVFGLDDGSTFEQEVSELAVI